MSARRGILCALLIACSGGKETTDTDPEITDLVADADTDTDSDTDTDTDADTDTGTTPGLPAAEDWTRNILSTDLVFDMAALTAKAIVTLEGSTTSEAASFEIGDLVIIDVVSDAGPLSWNDLGDQLDVGVPASVDPAVLTIDYAFSDHGFYGDGNYDFDGWMSGEGVTFLWPYWCGNLFPCKSDPADGLTFTMAVNNPSDVAVYPASIPSDAPSYMPAIAIGPFSQLALGTTTAGTSVSAWWHTGVDTEQEALDGTENLLAVFDFYEQTYGPYTFGTEVGSVSANWGPGDYGGMEHHPLWHVSQGGFGNEEIHAHEAGHGWFGNGVRIECWEDFVLSEGTTSYIALHALETVGGPNYWSDYADWLEFMCPIYGGSTPALPNTCDVIDIYSDPLWSGVPYAKGACFYEDVGDLIGIELLDTVLADFYQSNVGTEARMTEIIDALKLASPGDAAEIDTLVADWLTSAACPADYAARCSEHVPR